MLVWKPCRGWALRQSLDMHHRGGAGHAAGPRPGLSSDGLGRSPVGAPQRPTSGRPADALTDAFAQRHGDLDLLLWSEAMITIALSPPQLTPIAVVWLFGGASLGHSSGRESPVHRWRSPSCGPRGPSPTTIRCCSGWRTSWPTPRLGAASRAATCWWCCGAMAASRCGAQGSLSVIRVPQCLLLKEYRLAKTDHQKLSLAQKPFHPNLTGFCQRLLENVQKPEELLGVVQETVPSPVPTNLSRWKSIEMPCKGHTIVR